MEELRFEDAGGAWFSDAGDEIPNYRKFLFGLDPGYPVDHPVNAPLRGNLPHQVLNPEGILEMRCRPATAYLPEGNPALYIFPGQSSPDLHNWELVPPEILPNGELTVRYHGDTSAGFLRWEVLRDH